MSANDIKYIRSHRQRVKQANKTIRTNEHYKRERISIIDREAFVEFFLLEDILLMNETRLKIAKGERMKSTSGEKSNRKQIERYEAYIELLQSAIEQAKLAIDSGNYSIVWKSIPEHALMTKASSLKNLEQLKDMTVGILERIFADTRDAVGTVDELNRAVDRLESHDENARRVADIPATTEEKIADVIRRANEAFSDATTAKPAPRAEETSSDVTPVKPAPRTEKTGSDVTPVKPVPGTKKTDTDERTSRLDS